MAETLADKLEQDRLKREQGDWIPACNGTETPFVTKTGRRLLYCWQPSSGNHAYLDCETDLILTDQEAWLAMGL